ncbi:MAG: methyltransferase domain-containing protein [Clostridiales bacterium]|jgi:rhamnosyltransferase|nr:methyltransferase domain-containing protein [Clostridiales bacterium]
MKKDVIGNILINCEYATENSYANINEAERIAVDFLKFSQNLSVSGKRDETLNTLIANDKKEVLYHLSPRRKYLIDALPSSDKPVKVLELGSGTGAVTEGIVSRFPNATVTCVEMSKALSLGNAYRNRNANVEIYIGKFNDISLQLPKFDMIIVPIVDYYRELGLVQFIGGIRKLLTIDGTLYLAADSNVCGYNRIELGAALTKSGFVSAFFYYPKPDIKYPIEIYSDRHLPVTVDNTTFFFVECAMSARSVQSNVDFIKISDSRSPKFAVKTFIAGGKVIKEALFQEGKSHLRSIADNYEKLRKHYPLWHISKMWMDTGKLIAEFVAHTHTLLDDYREAYDKWDEEAFWKVFDRHCEIAGLNSKSSNFKSTAKFRDVFGRDAEFRGESAVSFVDFEATPENILFNSDDITPIIIDYEYVFDFPVPVNLVKWHFYSVLANHSLLGLARLISKEDFAERLAIGDLHSYLLAYNKSFLRRMTPLFYNLRLIHLRYNLDNASIPEKNAIAKQREQIFGKGKKPFDKWMMLNTDIKNQKIIRRYNNVLPDNPKRAAIYFFYDKDGIVDDYIPYMIQKLWENVNFIFFIVNGKLTPAGRQIITPLVDELYVRENEGFDVWAYKEAIEIIGWDKLADYDELVMINHTCFGPLYPFRECFDWAAKRDLDFWGLTKHHENRNISWKKVFPNSNPKYDYVTERIQSYFLVVRQPLLSSCEYRKMWDEMPSINSIVESIFYYENNFTEDFCRMGYIGETYCDTSDLIGITYDPKEDYARELIENRRLPLVKRKLFWRDYRKALNTTFGEPAIEVYEYIEKLTNYDTRMIWQNLLRCYNMYDLKFGLHLTRILPRDHKMPYVRKKEYKVLLVFHVDYDGFIPNAICYANNMPDQYDILFTVIGDETYKRLKEQSATLPITNNYEIMQMENHGHEVSSLLVTAAPYVFGYDLVFFLHDKKAKQMGTILLGSSWQKKCFENLLSNETYIENVINLFDRESDLGMAFPPGPYRPFGLWSLILDGEWRNSWNATKKILEDFKITVDYTKKKQPVAPLGNMFVFRPESLKLLLNGKNKKGWLYSDFPEEPNKYDDTIFHGIEQAYPYFVQQAGYYVAWLLNDKWYQIELDNFYFGWSIATLEKRKLSLKESSQNVSGFFKHFLQSLISSPQTHSVGMWLWKTYRRIFSKKHKV